MTGARHDTNSCGPLEIVEYINASQVEVRFIGTGYQTEAQAGAIRAGVIKDPLKPSVYGRGYFGVGRHRSSEGGKITKAYDCWHRMLARCYCEKAQAEKPTYIGVTVCDEWHDFQAFADWHESNYIEGCQIDKDIRIKGNKVYSPAACKFVTNEENSVEASAKHYRFIDPRGRAVDVYNLSKFCHGNNLGRSSMYDVHNGRLSAHKKWTKEKASKTRN